MKLASKTEIFEHIQNFLAQNPKGVLEVVGPTASGKTDFTVEIAEYIQKAEVIVVDSRQIYRHCDISSAKITPEEMKGIPHWGLNLRNPDETYNVVEFQKYAFETIEAIFDRGNIPILSGGTMLWLDAVSENYIFSDQIKEEAEETIFEKSTQRGIPKWPVLKIGIWWDRAVIYDRANKRAQKQFENGLIEETKKIFEQFKCSKSFWTSFGYREIKHYLDGEISYDRALAINQQRNRKYAKRQLTWWRGREDVLWVDGNSIFG